MEQFILEYYLDLLSEIENERSIVRAALSRLKVLRSELDAVLDLHRSLFPSQYSCNGLAKSNNILFASSNSILSQS